MNGPAATEERAAQVSAKETVTFERDLACRIKDQWLNGADPDAHAAMELHPELRSRHTVAIDLIYEEYCLRTENGEQLDSEEFCRRFPSFQRSISRLLAIHRRMVESTDVENRSRPPQPGEQIAGFLLDEELGRGGFARVYLAREAALGMRPVVVKITPRISTEAQLLGRLRHRNIVPVYSVHQDENVGTVVCMPYRGRVTLDDLTDKAFERTSALPRAKVIYQLAEQHRPVDITDERSQLGNYLASSATYTDGIVRLIAQVADALDYTHGQNICHGDLKPSNILLDWDGKPLLLDFNLSFDQQISDHSIGGTLPYMSPEQLGATRAALRKSKSTAQIDARSDIFSLGVILFELLSGELPFGHDWKDSTDATVEHLLQRQCEGAPSLRATNPTVDAGVARLVERCLQVDPERRPQSAAQVAADLRGTLKPTARVKRWGIRHRYVMAATFLLALVGTAALAVHTSGLPSRGHRALHVALDLLEMDRAAEAIPLLDQAVEGEPQMRAQALLARGHAYQRLDQLAAAMRDFTQYMGAVGDGRGYAALGYCFTLDRHWDEAIWHFRKAIDVGYDTPEVRNDLAFCLSMLGGAQSLDEATTQLDAALAVAPNLQAALYNRATLALQRAHDDPNELDRGFNCISHAIALSEPTPSACILAARLCALQAKQKPSDPKWRDRALDYLKMAANRGWDLSRLVKDRSFAVFLDHPAFTAVIQRPPSKQVPRLVERTPYIDPHADISHQCRMCSVQVASLP